jgi:hypothetical protein
LQEVFATTTRSVPQSIFAATAASAHGLCFGTAERLLVLRIEQDSAARMEVNVQNEQMDAVEVHAANLGHAMSS